MQPPPSDLPLGTNDDGPSNLHQQTNYPLYGALNTREPTYYINCATVTLSGIVASAPSQLRNRVTQNAHPDRSDLIADVLFLRYEEGIQTYVNNRSPQNCLEEVLSLDVTRLKAMAAFNPSHLTATMYSALQADPEVQPRQFRNDSSDLVTVVLTWQLNACRKAHGFGN